MLPFLKHKAKAAGGIVMAASKKDDGAVSVNAEADMHPLQIPAEDLIAAIEAKDALGIAMALQAAFDIADSMPHEEGPHLEEA